LEIGSILRYLYFRRQNMNYIINNMNFIDKILKVDFKVNKKSISENLLKFVT